MKRITFFITLTVFAVFSTFSVSGQKTDFSGTWKVDRTKSTLLEYLPTLARISIEIKGDSLLTERVYEGGDGQEYPFDENITLDGKECAITIYDMPRKTKASWSEQDGSVSLNRQPQLMVIAALKISYPKKHGKLIKKTKFLLSSFKNKLAGSESEGAFFFNKADQ